VLNTHEGKGHGYLIHGISFQQSRGLQLICCFRGAEARFAVSDFDSCLNRHFKVILVTMPSTVAVGYEPWRWRQQGPPKRWYLTTTLHGVTTLKEPFLGRLSNYFLSGASAMRDWNLCMAWKKWMRNHTTHPSSLWSPDLAPMRFLRFSNHEKGAPRQENRLFHYPLEACDKRSVARFREVGGAL
jgi:hypothetical protein